MAQPNSVYLRKANCEDKNSLIDAYERSINLHQPFTYPPENIDDYINKPHRYLVCLEDTHELVGTFNISNIVRGWFQSAYLGYEVFAPYQQRGLMHQGLLLLIEEAFTHLNLHRLEANIQPENLASIKLVAKAGFTKEGYSKNYLRVGGGQWKDHELWAILNNHWQEKT